MASNLSVCLLDFNRNGNRSSLDEKEYAMSAMSNLHLELTTAMNHVAGKLQEATEDGSGEIMEATCNTAIDLLKICADALAFVREGASNGD